MDVQGQATRYARDSGFVEGDETGLMPCLWIGIACQDPKWVPWFQGGQLPALQSPEARSWRGRPGQFVFKHQYRGTACDHVTLCGVALPLSTCSDGRAVARLKRLADRY
jgi:hypothetical protein